MMKLHHNDEASMINFDHSAKFTHLSILVPIEAELGLAQPQLVYNLCHLQSFNQNSMNDFMYIVTQ